MFLFFLPASNINKEEQSRAIKLALAFDGFDPTPQGFGRASHVLLSYSPSYSGGIRKEGKGRPRPPVEQEPAVEPQPEPPSHPASNKNKKGRGGSNNKKGVGVEEDSYLSPATSPSMSCLDSPVDSPSDGTHPLTPPAPPAGLSSPACLTTPPALGLSASANTSNIMDSSGKRARDTTHMEVPSSRQKVGPSESSSSQLTKRVSSEAAYHLVLAAMETLRQSNLEVSDCFFHFYFGLLFASTAFVNVLCFLFWPVVQAEEQAKETEKKLNEQNLSQAKIIEDLRKENDNLRNEKAAVERRAVETQKKIEEATRKIEILKAELQKTQNAFKHEFKRGYNRGYEDATENNR